MNHKPKTRFSAYINKLRKKGFDKLFECREGYMKCVQTQKTYRPEEMILLSNRRFKSEDEAEQITGVFVLLCQDGTKGISKVLHNQLLDKNLINFLNRVKVRIS